MVFRLYSEVLWYPGRQLNIMNMLQGTNNTPNNSIATTAAANSSANNTSEPAAPAPVVNKFSSIFSGLKKEKGEEAKVDYK